MKKIDYKKEMSSLYRPSAKMVDAVDVPAMNFLMIDGAGDPNNSKEFQNAVEALFGVSYAVKFMIKKGKMEIDYGVMPLEGLWWSEDMTVFDMNDKSQWEWTLMIMQPDIVTPDLIHDAREQVRKKRQPVALSKMRFESLSEGKAAQILHIGPFSEEGPTVQRVHDFIEEKGLKRSGKHHEIYLSDFRRTQPEKLKTVIRQPMR